MGRSMSIRALAPLLAAVAFVACEDTAAPVARAADVEGTVARLKTGDGVANLLVALIDDDGRVAGAATTDAGGFFRFEDVPPGPYTVRLSGLELAGLRPGTTAFDPEAREIAVAGGADPVRFAALGMFTQVVAEATCGGAPAPDVVVRVVGGATDALVRTTALGEVAAPVDPGHYVVIPTESPCALAPAFRVVEVLQGQTVRASFEEAAP